MNYALKVLLKEPFHLLTKPSGRKFLRLCWSLGDMTRHTNRIFKLFGTKFQIVDSWSFLWQYYEIFFKESYAFDSDKPDPVIIDCGSNIGLSVLYFKKFYPNSKIQCFEPDPDIYRIMCENTNQYDGVDRRAEAVWDHSDGIQLTRNHADGAYVSEEGESLKSIRLKDELVKHEVVDFLKMDIEGAEFTVIEDCKNELHRVRRIFLEIHTFADKSQNLSRIMKILEDAGFRFFIENANEQKKPLKEPWKVSATGMDVQLNLYAVKADEGTFS